MFQNQNSKSYLDTTSNFTDFIAYDISFVLNFSLSVLCAFLALPEKKTWSKYLLWKYVSELLKSLACMKIVCKAF